MFKSNFNKIAPGLLVKPCNVRTTEETGFKLKLSGFEALIKLLTTHCSYLLFWGNMVKMSHNNQHKSQ